MSKSSDFDKDGWRLHPPAQGRPVLSDEALPLPSRSSFVDLSTDQLRHGEKDYVRMRDLPGLLRLFPAEIERLETRSDRLIVDQLRKALRAEKKRGRQGHWRYSLSRHIGLAQALKAEERLIQAKHQS